jgi:environmental stress-induced protein Ves
VSGFAVVRAADRRVMRWKNGGGETAEIAVSPQGAGLDAFDWRLSMATVETDGPFSAFAGIDRTLSVLEGEGIRLMVGSDAPVALTPVSPPHSFPGDVAASADLTDGPIVDLNMMSRRGRIRHAVRRLRISKSAELALESAETIVFCADGNVRMELGGVAELARHDTAIWRNGPARARLSPRPRAVIYVIEIDPF